MKRGNVGKIGFGAGKGGKPGQIAKVMPEPSIGRRVVGGYEKQIFVKAKTR